MNRLTHIMKTVLGIICIYVSYLSVAAPAASNYNVMNYIRTHPDMASLPHIDIQAGYLLPALLCIVLVCALYLLDCVKARSLFNVLPALVLSVVWLCLSTTPLGRTYTSEPLRIFAGGGALVFAFAAFSALHGLLLWIVRKEKPAFSPAEAAALAAWVVVVYCLDNLTPTVENLLTLKLSGTSGVTVHMYYSLIGRLSYHLVLGGICVYPFLSRRSGRPYAGIALMALAYATLLIQIAPSVLPFLPRWLYDALNGARRSPFFAATQSVLWVPQTAVIALAGGAAACGLLKGKKDAQYAKTAAALMLLVLLYVMVLGNYPSDMSAAYTGMGVNDTMITHNMGSYIACALCVVFMCALWMMGRIRPIPLLSALPGLALCVAWLTLLNAPHPQDTAGTPLRMFGGGGALMFGMLSFSVLHGLHRWEAHGEKPVWDASAAARPIAWVVLMYLMDNMLLVCFFALRHSTYPYSAYNSALYLIARGVALPAGTALMCLGPFFAKTARRTALNITLIVLPSVSVVYGLLSNGFSPSAAYNTGFLSAVLQHSIFGAQSQLWPYLAFALIVSSVHNLRADKSGVRDTRMYINDAADMRAEHHVAADLLYIEKRRL